MIEIIREESPLRRQVWRFTANMQIGGGLELRLGYYATETRESKRHRKWVTENIHTTSNRRRWEHSKHWVAVPPVPQDVRAEVIRQVLAGVTWDIPGAESKPGQRVTA